MLQILMSLPFAKQDARLPPYEKKVHNHVKYFQSSADIRTQGGEANTTMVGHKISESEN